MLPSLLSLAHDRVALHPLMTQSSPPSSTAPGSSLSLPPPRGVPPFLHHLLTISTVQICREAGYTRSHSSALDALTSLLHLFIKEVGLSAKAFAELAGRQHVNLLDILAALDDYQHGVELLMEYRSNSDPLPFYHPVPPFPLPRPLVKVHPPGVSPATFFTPSFAALNPHIPPFLPPLPELRTYQATPAKVEATGGDVRKRKLEQNRAVEGTLNRLTALQHQRQREEKAEEEGGKRIKREASPLDDPLDRVDPSPPSSHIPLVAPLPPSAVGVREKERERVLSKNPFMALPLPPAPPAPTPSAPPNGFSPSTASTALEGVVPSPRRSAMGGGGLGSGSSVRVRASEEEKGESKFQSRPAEEAQLDI